MNRAPNSAGIGVELRSQRGQNTIDVGFGHGNDDVNVESGARFTADRTGERPTNQASLFKRRHDAPRLHLNPFDVGGRVQAEDRWLAGHFRLRHDSIIG